MKISILTLFPEMFSGTFSDVELIQLARNEAKDIFPKSALYPELQEKFKKSKTTVTPD